jgi:hypothetical protein
MHDVGLIERPLVDVNDDSLDANALTRQTDDAFDEQHTRPCQPDGDDVAAPRFGANIGQPVDKVESSVAIRRQHARAVDSDRLEHDAERDRAEHHDGHDADERARTDVGRRGGAASVPVHSKIPV